ncbi:unnamed protein product [Nesidiocoris tenuis]|uniref:DNA-directed RNA polymerase n=1 Tax=Nesidiocoris tenuis TaxID=355587 RepID=A0A6H5G2N3_9HEMI|nr:unnamed protein product [Nesidiocoris tenuis]
MNLLGAKSIYNPLTRQNVADRMSAERVDLQRPADRHLRMGAERRQADAIRKGHGSGASYAQGLVIIAENINRMRYMSHFRAVHRGAFFTTMRTTEARQLLPDAWGFICPVHTPDGAPCGLLNHLTKDCKVGDIDL